MMLRHSFNMLTEAKLIEDAIKTTIVNGIMTIDLCKEQFDSVDTIEFVDYVVSYIQQG
jgi:3-isopropylmalate dehydrogenase